MGVRILGGQKAGAGNVIVKQNGLLYRAGQNVKVGGDYTLYASPHRPLKFQKKQVRGFDGSLRQKTIVNVVSLEPRG